MTERSFVDPNILVCAHDKSAGAKQILAADLYGLDALVLRQH